MNNKTYTSIELRRAKEDEGRNNRTSETSGVVPPRGNKGVSIGDLVLRILAIGGTLGSAIAMGTTNETLPFISQFIQFKAQYKDLPTFTFFVIANSVVCGYLVLSLPLSSFHIIWSEARITRGILALFDTVMLALISSGASAAAAIVYLAHKGNASANWLAVCQQFNSFCDRITWSLIGSFLAALMFILLILLSTLALARR